MVKGEYISQLRFADNIDIFAGTLVELEQMLDGINESSKRVGLGVNLDKTKDMFNSQVILSLVSVDGTLFEVVQDYDYLGHAIQLGQNNFEKEAHRRIQLGWTGFGKLRRVFTLKFKKCLKTSLRAMRPTCLACGTETWTLTKGN